MTLVVWGKHPMAVNLVPTYFTLMPQIISKTYEVQIVGGIFTTGGNEEKTSAVFQDLDIPQQNIQVVVRIDGEQAKKAYADAVVKAIRNGNILVAVHNVTSSDSIIEVADTPKNMNEAVHGLEKSITSTESPGLL